MFEGSCCLGSLLPGSDAWVQLDEHIVATGSDAWCHGANNTTVKGQLLMFMMIMKNDGDNDATNSLKAMTIN